jgi:hypothetical protein
MTNKTLWIALLGLLLAGGERAVSAQQTTSSSAAQARREPVVVSGQVTEIHAPRLFTLRESEGKREVVVLTPRALSPALAQGATVRVEGAMRRVDAAELSRSAGTGTLDEGTLKRLSGRAMLVATSVLAAVEEPATEPTPPAVAEPGQPAPEAEPRPAARVSSPARLAIRASTLVAALDDFAGQQVRVLNARVVGLLEPGAFLVEPATEYLKFLGHRDRIVVLIHGGALRVPADLVVGSTVIVEGVARTLVGIRVTAEAPWPARLTKDTVERLEVRAAVLATSVQTPEGTELTGRSGSMP